MSTTPKKTRARGPRHYIARVHGCEQPLFVVAKSQRDALKALVNVVLATPEDLLSGGKADYDVLDTTVTPGQVKLVDVLKKTKDAA